MIKDFKTYLKEGRGNAFSGMHSGSDNEMTTGNRAFSYGKIDPTNRLEQTAGDTDPVDLTIKVNDVIKTKVDKKTVMGRVLKIIKDNKSEPIFYQISTKSGKIVEVDITNVVKIDYHGEDGNLFRDNALV